MLKDDLMKTLFDNVRKKRLWQENIPKTNVKKNESNERSYPYLYHVGDLA